MPRHIKIGLIVLAIGLSVSVGYFVDAIGRVRSLVANDKETAENPFTAPKAPLYKPTDPPLPVKIFFPAADGSVLLGEEDQTIFKSSELVNRAKQILEKLQQGPTLGTLTPALPKDAKVQEIFVSEKGTGFIDFINAIAANHPGGILNEKATTYGNVNSLTFNLTEILES